MLEVSGLSKTLGGRRIVDDVSFVIEAGVFGLLGPNGAGKTTLMSMLATLLEPDAGTIRLHGIDYAGHLQEIRRLIGYLPQDFGVYANASARETLDHFARLRGHGSAPARRRRVDELLVMVNLGEAADRRLDRFSGGMRQRFGIAQALLGNPQLLIVDEPTAGLDPAERQRFLNLLGELSRSVLVLLSTHLVDEIEQLADTVAVMRSGRLITSGRIEALVAPFEGQMWEATLPHGEADAVAPSCQVVARRVRRADCQLVVRAEQMPGPGFTARAPRLEDVFALTGLAS